jgi:low affinity Fe/Cu permease
MVFLIQKTQNRDTETIHLKLDELIRVTQGARNMMLDLEHMDDEASNGCVTFPRGWAVKRGATRQNNLDPIYPLVGIEPFL